MIRYLTVDKVLIIQQRLLASSGGAEGVRDPGALDSAVAQPRMAFGGEELYPDLVEKAAALGFSLVGNHPFVDGNKRAGHAAMETFLVLNGLMIDAPTDEQEAVVLRLAAGELAREDFSAWLRDHVRDFAE